MNNAMTGNDPVMLEAAEWMLQLQSRELNDESLAAWQVWLAADVRHRQAFDKLQRVQECIDVIPRLPWPSDKELAEDRPLPALPRSRGREKIFSLALAASIAAIGIAVFISMYMSHGGRLSGTQATLIETAVGELRRVPLEDGSMLTAGGRSRIEVKFSGTRRDIQLESGEAFFEIAKDPARPFVVHAGTASVEALGTAFNVRRTGDHVIVAVAEGTVAAADVTGKSQLTAGQLLRLGPHLSAKPVAMAPQTAAAWREGQRQYRAEPLADVVADLARYSTRRISIEDEAIGRLTVTGTVFERDIDKWVNSLESALPVRIHREGDGAIRITASEDFAPQP